MIALSVVFIVIETLTAAASIAVFLRIRHVQALKYVSLLAALASIDAALTAWLYVYLAFGDARSPIGSTIVLVLSLLSQSMGLVGWTSIMFHLFGVLNGIHPAAAPPVVTVTPILPAPLIAHLDTQQHTAMQDVKEPTLNDS